MEKVQIEKLKKQVIQNKITLIEMLHESKSGHPGGSLSCMDILTAIYERKIDFSKKERSKVVLSKGHAVPAVYSILNSKGIISDKEILTLRKLNSRLQGHPSVVKIPELDASTGLLGQGISIGIGMALAKKQNCSPEKVYVITGDGELVEGQNYEALAQAAFYNLDNLIVFVDLNKLCLSGTTKDTMNLGDVDLKFKSFGWNCIHINGHNMDEICDALDIVDNNKSKPLVIVCDTIKGNGISFMENDPAWHGGVITDELYIQAMKELKGAK